jgi:hypothetical protein
MSIMRMESVWHTANLGIARLSQSGDSTWLGRTCPGIAMAAVPDKTVHGPPLNHAAI